MHEKIEVEDQEIAKVGRYSITIEHGEGSGSPYQENKKVMVDGVKLMQADVVSGRPNAYNFIELYNITPEIEADAETLKYHGSKMEDAVLEFFSRLLRRADLLHVEYAEDEETWGQLQSGVPPALSRLGYKLFDLGFTWFKDWYIAEGWKEGPVKLTAEKPLDEEMVERNLRNIKDDVKAYQEKTDDEDILERADKVLERISEVLENPSKLLD